MGGGQPPPPDQGVIYLLNSLKTSQQGCWIVRADHGEMGLHDAMYRKKRGGASQQKVENQGGMVY